jgi:hypothetical protein
MSQDSQDSNQAKARTLWERFFIPPDPKESPQQTLVVEVDRGQRPEVPGKDLRESIIALKLHPGFDYLLRKLRFQRAYLEAKLRSEHHKEIREVDFLQSGIGWLNWLESQINFETGKKDASEPTQPVSYERKLFEEVNRSINALT